MKLINQAVDQETGHQKYYHILVSKPITKRHVECLEVKVFLFTSEDSKQLLSRFYSQEHFLVLCKQSACRQLVTSSENLVVSAQFLAALATSESQFRALDSFIALDSLIVHAKA